MDQKIIQSGNSLAVTLPKKFVESLGIKKGDTVKVVKRVDRGSLTLIFETVVQQLKL